MCSTHSTEAGASCKYFFVALRYCRTFELPAIRHENRNRMQKIRTV